MVFYDNASTTKVDDGILNEYIRYQTEQYFNPSAPYPESSKVKADLDNARKRLLAALKGDGNVIFLSSGTEADNQALFCTKKQKNSKILIASAEHPAIYQSASELRQRGYQVDFCGVDCHGRVQIEDFRQKMTSDTDLVSVMHVSNETGAINDIAGLVKVAKSINPEVLFHSDGVQAVGKIPVNLRTLGVDLYSFSGHKIHAPKGVAALYVKKGVRIRPLLFGGGQESGLRSSTENAGGIVALTRAVELSYEIMDETKSKLLSIRNRLIGFLKSTDPDLYFLSDTENSSPNILSFASRTVRGEVMLHALEGFGIMIGTGSACASKKASRRVPEDLNVPTEYMDGIIRLSFSKYNEINECEYFENCFKQEYLKLQKYTRG